jgi:N-acetylneuraminic acid mutarotase
MSVIKESFFEASFKTIEEFDNAEVAAVKSNVGDYAELTIMDIKLDKSVIKTNQEKEHGNATNEQHSKIVSEIK